MNSFLASLFIWWRGQSIGTHLFTSVNGSYIGSDGWGNKYYKSKKGERRWVLYHKDCDASLIPPKWHSWLHKVVNEPPASSESIDFESEEMYKNETGTHNSYHPNKVSSSLQRYYTAWEPKS